MKYLSNRIEIPMGVSRYKRPLT